jgi:muramoyltetrapeptide carboxypeptidase
MAKLYKGNKVGIASPSGFIVSEQNIETAISYIESLGYVPIVGKNVYKKWRYMAGTINERVKDLMDFYKDPDIKAIFTTVGAGGSQYLLDKLDYNLIQANPKPLIGFSDTTAIQNAIYTKTGIVNFTGFTMHYDFRNGAIDELIDKSLQDLLKGKSFIAKGGKTVHRGIAEGKLVGGCLSVLRNLCGTEYYPDLTDSILLLEDVGERTYRTDLMLLQLRQNPTFKNVRGIIFGEFSDSEIRMAEDGNIDSIIYEFCKDLNIPIIKNFPYSHEDRRYVLPLGANVKLDATKHTLKIYADED